MAHRGEKKIKEYGGTSMEVHQVLSKYMRDTGLSLSDREEDEYKSLPVG